MLEKEVLYAMNTHPLNYSKGYLIRKEQLEKCKRQFKSFLSDSSLQSTPIRRSHSIFSLPGALSSNSNISNEEIKQLELKRTDFNQRHRRQFLIACLKLLTSSKQCTIRPEVLLDESRHLFEKQSRDVPAIISTLDEHLMFVAVHWPLKLKESLKDSICPSTVLYKSLQSWEEVVKELPDTARRMDKMLLYVSKTGNFPYLIKAENVDKNNCHLFNGKILSNGFKVEVSLQGFNIDVGAKVEIRFYRRVRRSLYWNRDVYVVIGFGQHGPRAELAEDGSLLRQINMPTTTNEDKGKPSLCHIDLHDRTYKKGLTETSNFINHAPNMVYKTDILDQENNLKSSSIQQLLKTSHFPVSDKFPIFHDNGLFSDEKKTETTETICENNNQCAEYRERKQNGCGSRTSHDSNKNKMTAENLSVPKPRYTKEITTRTDLEKFNHQGVGQLYQ
ncbi:unnamed protein product [Mytilus edulis]|uniref:Uncharacterized protein n=1 Tax=Mytilus edulis TaxID=6550 RepID=A0A8S3TIB7_MYTED|nr:unnamed protein product [Mytilus edulis]